MTWLDLWIIVIAKLMGGVWFDVAHHHELVEGFFKAVRMSARQLYLIIVLLVIGCQSQIVGGIAQDNPPKPVETVTAESELDKQLKIYKNALLEGKDEQIRIDAATVMLFSENPQARVILLDALKQSDNIAARVAVCKALSQTRAWLTPIKNKDDFIGPLIEVLSVEDADIAKLAAEATLIFDYDQVSGPLERLVSSSSVSIKTRLNAMYALELHPDMRAAIKFIELMEDPEKQIASAAENTLCSMGIQVGRDAASRKQAIDALKREGSEAFLRRRLIHQITQMRDMQFKLNFWQGLYLSALNKMYEGISDDGAKGKFLAEYLQSPQPVVKLWSLEKVSQDRVGSRPNPKLPAEVGPILVNMISDPDKDVRLRTAQLLSLMGELNCAEKLLAQLGAEQDEDVKMELFVALGYAFVPNPNTKIPNEMQKQALEWAVKYLAEQDSKKAQKGAEVMKKLLDHSELTSTEVDRFFGFLAERYKNSGSDSVLHGELLRAMAGLCAPQSAHNAQAKKRFKILFEQALQDGANPVREAAVDGLIHIDKTETLERLRKGFINDPSIIVRRNLIELAGEVGGKDDMVWLAEKIGLNAEGEPCWQAMLKILRRSDGSVVNLWMEKLILQDNRPPLSDAQKISFLEICEQKVTSENEPKMLKTVWQKLAELCAKTGQFERAAGYLGKLRETAGTIEEKEAILPDLLSVYLRWPKVELAARLVENCLEGKDLDTDSTVIVSIEDYLSNPPAGADPNVVLKALLSEIKVTNNRPKWEQQKMLWDRLDKVKEPNVVEKGEK